MPHKPVRNPWLRLPESASFVLPEDEPLLEKFNARAKPEHFYDLNLYPDPYFGSLNASVVVLLLNPGLHEKDREEHERPDFAEIARKNLAHKLEQYPFMYLHPAAASTPGSEWWQKRTRQLRSDVGDETVAKNLACIQYMPYHSKKYRHSSVPLPSQAYTFHLVRQAIARGAEIVILRSRDIWLQAVPELEFCEDRLHFGANARATYLTRGNLHASYDRIAQRLSDG